LIDLRGVCCVSLECRPITTQCGTEIVERSLINTNNSATSETSFTLSGARMKRVMIMIRKIRSMIYRFIQHSYLILSTKFLTLYVFYYPICEIRRLGIVGTVNGTSDYTLWTLCRSYFKGISANIEVQMRSMTWHNIIILMEAENEQMPIYLSASLCMFLIIIIYFIFVMCFY
jgi:hypothetical protein